MKNIQREDIEHIALHNQLSEETLRRALQEQVYPDSNDWKYFLKLLFLTLGIGLCIAGIVFFFAYNWDDLHKFIKLGIVETLVIITTGLALWKRLNHLTRKILLTGSSVLVGLLFAVFGQIYQTGANAYDFFLAWTAFIAIWVFVSNFTPLWLFYIILINTTLILYEAQVGNWPTLLLYCLLFIGNSVVAVISKQRGIPPYFVHTISLAALTFATIGVITGIVGLNKSYFELFVFLVTLIYSIGIWYGIHTKSTFYLSAIPFSSIIMISTYLLDISNDEWMLLTISIFITVSVTLVVRNLIQLIKKKS